MMQKFLVSLVESIGPFDANHHDDFFVRFRRFMCDDLQWRRTVLAARQANGRGERERAIRLMTQSVDEARDPLLPWNELQSALVGSALFHEHVTLNFSLAMQHYRESYDILSANIGAESQESRSFAECMADCEAKLRDASC